MKARDGSFDGEFALVSGKNKIFDIRSHFGPEPTSNSSSILEKDTDLQEYTTPELREATVLITIETCAINGKRATGSCRMAWVFREDSPERTET